MTRPTLDSLASLAAIKTVENPDSVGNSAASAAGPAICGDVDIRIDRDAQWFYHGSPIGRKELVRLFAGVLQRGEAGDYWLVTPAEMARIQVEDVPFTAVEMAVEGAGENQTLRFRTNVDDIVIADREHPLKIVTDPATGEPSPYVRVRGGLDARLTRAVYYQLVDLGLERKMDGRTVFGVWSAGEFFEIGELET